jgi:hypothetical protein
VYVENGLFLLLAVLLLALLGVGFMAVIVALITGHRKLAAICAAATFVGVGLLVGGFIFWSWLHQDSAGDIEGTYELQPRGSWKR